MGSWLVIVAIVTIGFGFRSARNSVLWRLELRRRRARWAGFGAGVRTAALPVLGDDPLARVTLSGQDPWYVVETYVCWVLRSADPTGVYLEPLSDQRLWPITIPAAHLASATLRFDDADAVLDLRARDGQTVSVWAEEHVLHVLRAALEPEVEVVVVPRQIGLGRNRVSRPG
jgi:hypothetical protein